MKKLYIISSLLLVTLLFSSCYAWYQKQIPIDDDSIQISLRNFLYEEPKITSLNPPTQVLASQGMYSKTIKIRWNEVQNAKEYRIERAIVVPDENGEYTLPDDGEFNYLDKIMSNLYIDTIIKQDTYEEQNNNEALYKNLYFYRISAENIINGLDSSEFTSINNESTKAIGWLLSAPEKVEASKGKSQDGVNITWEPVINAKRYQIWRNTKDSDIGRELLKTVSASRDSYFDTMESDDKGKDFYYQVKAILPEESESEFSTRALGYALKEGATEPPANVTVINQNAKSKDSLKIQWDPSVPADNIHTKITYSLFRTSSESSVIKAVKTGLSSTVFTDTDNLEENVIYYYFVQTIATNSTDSKDYIKSAFSDVTESSSGWLLSPPKNLEVSKSSNNNVLLKWIPPVGYEKSNFSYKIFYSESQDVDSFNSLDSNNIQFNNGVYTCEVQTHKFFRLKTVNEDVNGLESSYSIIAAPSPDSPAQITATKTSGKYNLLTYAYNGNEVYPVRISWKEPSNDTPFGYHVYRSTKPDSSFRKLTDEPIQSSENGEFTFIDQNESARAGTLFYYKVISINELGKGKPVAEENNYSIGYGAITRDQWFREFNKTIMHSQTKLKLMHKPNDMDKLGSETINGDISGTLSYDASIAGLGAEITMHYENYCDYYIGNNKENGVYYLITGNTDTSSNMSANGNMHGTVTVTGMYPGTAGYGNLEIKGGAAGGGGYLVHTKDLDGTTVLEEAQVHWLVGEE